MNSKYDADATFNEYLRNLKYNKNTIKEIDIPYGVTTIPDSAFSGYTSLKSIHIPKTVKTIFPDAFSQCLFLEHIDLAGVEFIYSGAFSDCRSLKCVNIDFNNLRAIDIHAFENCSSLSKITVSSSTKVAPGAFVGCASLRYITIAPKFIVYNGKITPSDIHITPAFFAYEPFCLKIPYIFYFNDTLNIIIDDPIAFSCCFSNKFKIMVPIELIDAYKTRYPELTFISYDKKR